MDVGLGDVVGKARDAERPLSPAEVDAHPGRKQLLLTFNADVVLDPDVVHRVNKFSGVSLLSKAASRNLVDAVELLLRLGAEVDAPSERMKRTPLMSAAFWGATECALLLLDAGADIHVTDTDGKNAKTIAIQRGNEDTATVLAVRVAERWCDIHPTLPAVLHIRHKANTLDRERRARARLLIRACRRGHLSTVLSLLANLRNLDLDATDKFGVTGLEYAKRNRFSLIVKALEKAKAYVARVEAGTEADPYPYLGGENWVPHHLRRKLNVEDAGDEARFTGQTHPAHATVFAASAALERFAEPEALAKHAVTMFRFKGGPRNDQLFDFTRFEGATNPQQALQERRLEQLRAQGEANPEGTLRQLKKEEVPGVTRPLTVAEMAPSFTDALTGQYAMNVWLKTKGMEAYNDRLYSMGVHEIEHLSLVDTKRMEKDMTIAGYRRRQTNAMAPDQKRAMEKVRLAESRSLKSRLDRLKLGTPHPPAKDDSVLDVVKMGIFGMKFGEC